MRRTLIIPACFALLAGCAVGPNYKRPQIAVPDQFRGAPAQTPNPSASLADTKWVDLFPDPTLQQIVRNALDRNFDLKIAAERVAEARAQLGITRANQFPFVDLQTGFSTVRNSSVAATRFLPRGSDLSASYTSVSAAVSWEIDLWGRLRRLTEAARAQYLASEEGRRAVQVSLIADTMTTYFQLREQDLELEISRQTRDVGADSLRLTQLRRERGAASGLDVHQAEQLLYTATAQIAAAERTIAQTEDALSLLQGNAPVAQPRGARLEDLKPPPDVPAGLPSALLERRPDVREAEQNLVAANAQIGAARALLFPQISLTGAVGAQDRALSDLISGPARVYSIAPTALQPIFRAGQIRSQIRLTEAQQRELLVTYQRTIYTALREVSDALIGYGKTREQREQQEQLVRALDDTVRLSNLRYRGGLDSYLQVLDAQRNLFSGQLALAQLRLQERIAVVQIYRSLGGGWQ